VHNGIGKELDMDEQYDVSKIHAQSDSLIDNGKSTYSEMEAELSAKMKKKVEDAAERGCVPCHVFSVDVTRKAMDVHQHCRYFL
jgi:hypothetical protein